MNATKLVTGFIAALATVTVIGCGQEYMPQSANPDLPDPDMPDQAFQLVGDQAPYRFVSYDFLRAILTDVLMVPPDGTPSPNNPMVDPTGYFEANKLLLGAPNYQADPTQTTTAAPMSSGGFKVWVIAATSACGESMTADPSRLFPAGIDNYDHIYNVTVGRAPTAEEELNLDALANAVWLDTKPATTTPAHTMGQPVFTTQEKKAAALCSAVLASLEFLGDT